jgi:hypothetical protein
VVRPVFDDMRREPTVLKIISTLDLQGGWGR